MTHSQPPLKQTPLHATHLGHKARMVPFGGWDMPVEYSGITDEHMAVRTRAGLFDVSHMGEIEIAGADALAAVQKFSSNDASRLAVGQIHYSALTTPQGTFVDDLLVYRMADDHFLLVVNASNIEKDYAWIRSQVEEFADAPAVNNSQRYALLALQGPLAAEVLQTLTAVDLAAIKYYWFENGEIAGVRGMISRTGYTGEDGFEVFVPPAQAPHVWQAILQAGASAGVVPAGLGARDTLRLEASMRLFGNDMDETTTVLEAGLGWIVGWKKETFNGADVLRAQKAGGVERTLVGLEMIDRAIARHGYPVIVDGQAVGTVTSGTQTPFLKKAIAMAYVPTAVAQPDRQVHVEVRGRLAAARIVPMPFYKRPRS
ncbi:aminomethyltransferase [Luteitalea sp. TBR-22]|uniref:glycine cleavage system aminomethyltransferase GcvT n=1 Tax=Luteitalea sp. TBR-22 TaxID=2802971 RepID=UPI001AFB0C62|nr:glycine cleavage system aminomethyltransferase GcvT [Luteitalea sp. TBR-22]BCS33314.1 aminomethyltransferase [Luteitalea sp. TBR-22]